MAKNRSVERNRIKYIRQQRARPRYLQMNYGHMKVSQSVDRERIPLEARALFEYRKRARIDGDAYREMFITAVLDTLYPIYSLPVPKQRAPEALRLSVSNLEPVERKLLIHNGRYVKVAVIANRDLDCVQLLEYQVLPGIIRRSITYSSYDRARIVHELGKVRWKDTYNIPHVELSPVEN